MASPAPIPFSSSRPTSSAGRSPAAPRAGIHCLSAAAPLLAGLRRRPVARFRRGRLPPRRGGETLPRPVATTLWRAASLDRWRHAIETVKRHYRARSGSRELLVVQATPPASSKKTARGTPAPQKTGLARREPPPGSHFPQPAGRMRPRVLSGRHPGAPSGDRSPMFSRKNGARPWIGRTGARRRGWRSCSPGSWTIQAYEATPGPQGRARRSGREGAAFAPRPRTAERGDGRASAMPLHEGQQPEVTLREIVPEVAGRRGGLAADLSPGRGSDRVGGGSRRERAGGDPYRGHRRRRGGEVRPGDVPRRLSRSSTPGGESDSSAGSRPGGGGRRPPTAEAPCSRSSPDRRRVGRRRTSSGAPCARRAKRPGGGRGHERTGPGSADRCWGGGSCSPSRARRTACWVDHLFAVLLLLQWLAAVGLRRS